MSQNKDYETKQGVMRQNEDETMTEKRENNRKRAALFFDIDGTILSETTGRIPESAIEAMRQAQEKGHLLFINTGRTFCSIPAELHKFDFDGYMCGCGSYLVCQDKVLLESHVEKKRGEEIVRKMKECRLEGILEGTEDVYFPAHITRFEALESSRHYFQNSGLGTERFVGETGIIYDKLFVYEDTLSRSEEFFDFVSSDMEVIDRGKHTYEIAQKAYSKASACEFMRERLKMSMDDIYVFGDSGNDLSMFEYAKHAVALGNHAAVLDAHAEFVTKDVDEGGIAYALKHYGLI